MRTILLALVLVALATPALASDGVLEINQTCAVETGCAPEDSPGFPVSLSGASGRSVRLTSDLLVPDGNVHGIQLNGSGISVDLNLFAIIREGCETGTFCADATGSMRGVVDFNREANSIRNGSIIGMGGCAVSLTYGPEIRNLRLASNGNGVCTGPEAIISKNTIRGSRFSGIVTQSNAIITENVVRSSGATGINTRGGSIVSGNSVIGIGTHGIQVSSGNGASIIDNVIESFSATGDGIECTNRCQIRANTVSGFGGNGIQAGTESRATDNIVYNSALGGIEVSTSSVVSSNTINHNGGSGISTGNASTIRDNTTNLNGGAGIEAGNGSNVNGNTARSNTEFGLLAESTLVGFSGNVFGNNNGGAANPQTSSGRDLGGNQCDTVASCP